MLVNIGWIISKLSMFIIKAASSSNTIVSLPVLFLSDFIIANNLSKSNHSSSNLTPELRNNKVPFSNITSRAFIVYPNVSEILTAIMLPSITAIPCGI